MSRLCDTCQAELPGDTPDSRCPKCLRALGLDETVGDAGGVLAPLTAADGPQRLGDYELLEEIARGGMGVVYKARQVSLNRLVALKLILSGQFASKQEVLRFRGEAEAAANLRHPNIVAIYETGEHGGRHFFSMEFVEGQDLAALVREGPLSAQRAAHYAERIGRAIHYAHEQGTLHRDLKPSNVLVDRHGEPRVTDFGLAKRRRGDFGLTVTGQMLGTPNFMPPEQMTGKSGELGPACDVYGLGAILYHLLTGRPPFHAETLEEVIRQVHEQDPVPPRLLNPSVPRDLETICLVCLEKQPSRRYPTAEAFAEELGRFLRDEPIRSRPIGRPEKLWRWCRRKPALAGLLGLLILVAAIGVAAVGWQWNRATRTARELAERVYASDINLAARALAEKDVGRAADLLQRHIPRPGEIDRRGFEWRLLWGRCQGDQLESIAAHEAEVTSLAVSPEGDWLITGSFDRTVKLWDLPRRRFVSKLFTFPDQVQQLQIVASADGRLVAAGDGRHLRVWETAGWREIKALEGEDVPLAMLPRANALVCADRDPLRPGLRVWDTTTWQVTPRPMEVQAFGASPDGRWLAVARGDPSGASKGIVLLDGEWNEVGQLGSPSHALAQVQSMVFSSDGALLAIGDVVGQIEVWDTVGRQRLARFQAHERFTTALAFSPDGRLLASGSGTEQPVALWDTRTWEKVADLLGHRNGVWGLAFTPDSRELLSASRDRTVRIWRAKAQGAAEPVPEAPAVAGFLPGGQTAVLLDAGHLILWDVAAGRESGRHRLTRGQTASAAELAPEGALVAVGYRDGSVEVRHRNDWAVERRFVLSTNPVSSIRLSPGTRTLAAIALSRPGAATASGRLGVWDVPNGEPLSPLVEGMSGAATAVAFSHDGSLIAVAGTDHSVLIWSLAARRERHRLRGHTWEVPAVAFSPDDRVLASGSWDSTIRLWEVATGELKGVLAADGTGLCFSPDGRTLVASPLIPPVRLFHVPSQQEMLSLDWEGTFPGKACFSPAGDVLAQGSFALVTRVAGANDRVRFWKVPIPAPAAGDAPARPPGP